MLTFDKPREIALEICNIHNVTLNNDNLKRFADIIVPMKLIRGKHPVSEGEVCDYIFYVKQGLVLQTYEKNEATITENIACDGDFTFCVESFFKREPSKLTLTTLEPSIIYGLPHDKLFELAHTSYEICQLIFTIQQTTLFILQHRADAMRFESARDKYVRLVNEKPEIVRRAPMHNIASFLQMTPETLSRVRSTVNSEEF